MNKLNQNIFSVPSTSQLMSESFTGWKNFKDNLKGDPRKKLKEIVERGKNIQQVWKKASNIKDQNLRNTFLNNPINQLQFSRENTTQNLVEDPFNPRYQVADKNYIDWARERYNKRDQYDLILNDLNLDFDQELDKAKEYYKDKQGKDFLTRAELDDWFGGKKDFGDKPREEEGEIEIYPGIYLWNGRAFIGSYRTPIGETGVEVTDEKGNKKVVLQNGTILHKGLTLDSAIDAGKKYLQSIIPTNSLTDKYILNTYGAGNEIYDFIKSGLIYDTEANEEVEKRVAEKYKEIAKKVPKITTENSFLNNNMYGNITRNRVQEWANYVKNTVLNKKRIVNNEDIGTLNDFFSSDKYDPKYNKIIDNIVANSPYWKKYKEQNGIDYNAKTLNVMLLNRLSHSYKTRNILLALYRQQKESLEKLRQLKPSEGGLTQEQYDKQLEGLNNSFLELKEIYPDNKAVYNAFTNSSNYIDNQLKQMIQRSINVTQTSIMTDLRKATTSAYNNSEIKQFGMNGTMQFLGYVVDQLTGQGESTEKKIRKLRKDDTVLHVSNSLFYRNPGSIAIDDIEALDAENAQNKINLANSEYEKIKDNPEKLKELSARGDYLAKSMPGYESDSDDTLHEVLRAHGFDTPGMYTHLTKDQTDLALSLLALEHDALNTLYDDPKEIQRQFQADLQKYNYDSQDFIEKVGTKVYSWGTTIAGLSAQLMGFSWRTIVSGWKDLGGYALRWASLGNINTGDIDSFFKGLMENPFIQWGHNLQSTGIWGVQDAIDSDYQLSLLDAQKQAQEGRAFTKEEIDRYKEAGIFLKPKMVWEKGEDGKIHEVMATDKNGNVIMEDDNETLDALTSGQMRTGGGNTFGIITEKSANEAASGGLTLSDAGLFIFDVAAVATQMAAVRGVSVGLSEIGKLISGAGRWMQACKTLSNSSGVTRFISQKLTGNVLRLAGHSLTATAPHMATFGLNFGYCLSSYQEHLQDAQSKIYSNVSEGVLAAPSDGLKALIDREAETNPNAIRGNMSDTQYQEYINSIYNREINRIEDEINAGKRGTEFLIDKSLEDPNNPLSANFSYKNIDEEKVKEYVRQRILQNKKYIYLMDQYAKEAEDAARTASEIEFAFVCTADASLLQALKPSLYMTKGVQIAQRQLATDIKLGASNALKATAKGLDKVVGKVKKINTYDAIQKFQNKVRLKVKDVSRSIKDIKVDKNGIIKDINPNAPTSEQVLQQRVKNNSIQGFVSNYLQDVAVGFDKGLYDNYINNYIVNTYSPSNVLASLGPITAQSQYGYLDKYFGKNFTSNFKAGLEGAAKAATQWTSFRDGFIGAAAGWITPQIQFGSKKYIGKNLTTAQKASNLFSPITNMKIQSEVTSFIKSKFFNKSTRLTRQLDAQAKMKSEFAKKLGKALEGRNISILSNISQLKKAIEELRVEEQQETLDPKAKKVFDEAGITVEAPLQGNVNDQLTFAECLFELANAPYISADTGKKINNGRNPAAEAYRNYVKSKADRKEITKERLLKVLTTYQENERLRQEGNEKAKSVNELFKEDPEAISILDDLFNDAADSSGNISAEEQIDVVNDTIDLIRDSEDIEDPNNPGVIIKGSNSDELGRRLSVINDATTHAKQTSKIIKLYRQNIQNAYSELGEAFSSDPVLLRAYAKERTKADLIKIRVDELQSKKKEIQKQLDEFKEKLEPSENIINEKNALTFQLVELGYDENRSRKRLGELESKISGILTLIQTNKTKEAELCNNIGEELKLKGKKDSWNYNYILAQLQKIINEQTEEFHKRQNQATTEEAKNEVKPSELFTQATAYRKELIELHDKIECLNKYGIEELPFDSEGHVLIDINNTKSLKELQEEKKQYQEVHDVLLQMHNGEDVGILVGNKVNGNQNNNLEVVKNEDGTIDFYTIKKGKRVRIYTGLDVTLTDAELEDNGLFDEDPEHPEIRPDVFGVRVSKFRGINFRGQYAYDIFYKGHRDDGSVFTEKASIKTDRPLHKIEEGEDTSNYIFTPQQIIEMLASKQYNTPFMAFIQSLLFEHVQVNNFKADSYSSGAIAKQVQALEQVFGKDLELLKKAVSTNLNLNLAEKTHEAFEDSIIHLLNNYNELNDLAAVARQESLVSLYKLGFRNFADTAKSYQEFIALYRNKIQEINDSLPSDEEISDEEKVDMLQKIELQKRALDLAVKNNEFFKEYQNRINQYERSPLKRSIASLMETIQNPQKITTEEKIATLKKDLNENIEKCKKELGIDNDQLITTLFNLLENLVTYSEKRVPIDIAKIKDTLNTIEESVLQKTTEQSVIQGNDTNTSLTIENIKDYIIPLMLGQLSITEENNRIARAISGEKQEKAEKEGEEIQENSDKVSREITPLSFNNEKQFKTYQAQIASYIPHLDQVLTMLEDLKSKGTSAETTAQILNTKLQLLSLSPVLTHEYGILGRTTSEESIKKMLINQLQTSDIQILRDALTDIYNREYQENSSMSDVIDAKMAAIQGEYNLPNNSMVLKFLSSLMDITKQSVPIPITYDRVLITPEQEQAERNTPLKSEVYNNPFTLSTFYRQAEGTFMRNLVEQYSVDEYLTTNHESLQGKDVVFLYNTQVQQQLIDQVPKLKDSPEQAVVAAAVEDANGSITINTVDEKGQTVQKHYQIIGFLPANSTAKNNFKNKNSAVVARKNIDQSVERYQQKYQSESNDVWIPIYDFSSKKSDRLITTKVRRTTAINTNMQSPRDSQTTAMVEHNNTKNILDRVKRVFRVSKLTSKIFKQEEDKKTLFINVGSPASSLYVPINEPHMDQVINSNNNSFQEVKNKFKKERSVENTNAVINFNSKTKNFAEQIKGLLLATKRSFRAFNETKSDTPPVLIDSTILTRLINGINPNTGDPQAWGAINGFSDFHTRQGQGLNLSNNIFCRGGRIYRVELDGKELRLFLSEPNNEKVVGTEVTFDLNDVAEDGYSFVQKEGEEVEEGVNKIIADFIIALSSQSKDAKDNINTIADFSSPRASFLKDNPTDADEVNMEQTFKDGIYTISEYTSSADVQIEPIVDEGAQEEFDQKVQESNEQRINQNSIKGKPLQENIANQITAAINRMLLRYTKEMPSSHKKTAINEQNFRDTKNFGASTEDASKVVEGKERSMHTMLGLILGNIADDMVKKIASGIGCKYSDYSSILTQREFSMLNNMITDGLETFLKINNYRVLTDGKGKQALEVILRDDQLIQELKDEGLEGFAPRNILDLVVITPRGTLAIIDAKTHTGDTIDPKNVSTYVRQLNRYAKLFNNAIRRYKNSRSEPALPQNCIVDELYLFEIPTANKGNITYSKEFNIEEYTDEKGAEMRRFTRKSDTSVSLINEGTNAHLSKFALMSDKVAEEDLQGIRQAYKEFLKGKEEANKEGTDIEVVKEESKEENGEIEEKINTEDALSEDEKAEKEIQQYLNKTLEFHTSDGSVTISITKDNENNQYNIVGQQNGTSFIANGKASNCLDIVKYYKEQGPMHTNTETKVEKQNDMYTHVEEVNEEGRFCGIRNKSPKEDGEKPKPKQSEEDQNIDNLRNDARLWD